MISFKQLESGTPLDIEVTCDDGNAEMAQLDEVFHGEFDDFQATINLDGADRNAEGHFVFVIPGGEAGEIAEFYLPLDEFLDAANQKAIAAAEKAAESH